jgi:hypothetical protein
VSREVSERGARGDTTAAARHARAPVRSRPPAVAVLLVALLVAGTIIASVAGTLSLSRGSGTGGSPLAPVAAPPEMATPPAAASTTEPTEAAPTAAPTAAQPAPPADPRSVFQDPELRALAEPFLAGPAVSCAPRDPDADVAERVACDLGGGRAAVFSRLLTPDVMRDQRRGIVAGQGAQPGTVLSVRWRYPAGGPETRAGIPPGQRDRGEGVRVRFVDREGVPRLYFDQDSSGCTGDLSLTRPTGNDRADLEALRTFWADPAG